MKGIYYNEDLIAVVEGEVELCDTNVSIREMR